MHIPKKYIHDRMILLLLSTTVFLVALSTVLTMVNLDSGGSLNLVQYRPNLGLSAYTYDSSPITYFSFIAFSFLVGGIHIALSMRAYLIRRQYAVAVLSMGILLLVLSIVVSNALLLRG
jgi:hypothetical protein